MAISTAPEAPLYLPLRHVAFQNVRAHNLTGMLAPTLEPLKKPVHDFRFRTFA